MDRKDKLQGMDRKDKLQKTTENCIKLLKDKFKVKKIFLIGSLARGFIHERSDIDLVVEGLQPELYMKALTDLWDILPLDVELNLIPFEDAFKTLKEKVEKEGKLVYG